MGWLPQSRGSAVHPFWSLNSIMVVNSRWDIWCMNIDWWIQLLCVECILAFFPTQGYHKKMWIAIICFMAFRPFRPYQLAPWSTLWRPHSHQWQQQLVTQWMAWDLALFCLGHCSLTHTTGLVMCVFFKEKTLDFNLWMLWFPIFKEMHYWEKSLHHGLQCFNFQTWGPNIDNKI